MRGIPEFAPPGIPGFGLQSTVQPGNLSAMEWVTLTKLFSPAEADVLRSRLESSGFTVTLKNMGAALSTEGYSMAAGGIWVQVPAAEESDARLLMNSCREGASGEGAPEGAQ